MERLSKYEKTKAQKFLKKNYQLSLKLNRFSPALVVEIMARYLKEGVTVSTLEPENEPSDREKAIAMALKHLEKGRRLNDKEVDELRQEARKYRDKGGDYLTPTESK